MKQRICFLTTNDFGFGGSEDLWIEAVKRCLHHGIHVAVSVRDWRPRPAALQKLAEDSRCTMLWHSAPLVEKDIVDIAEFNPDLVVISKGFQLEGLDWMARLGELGIPYVVIVQCVHEAGWPGMDEALIGHMHTLHEKALRLFFVSRGNRSLYERMIGHTCSNADIVINPFKVSYNVNIPWLESPVLRLATVGRLECFHKGYDLLLEVLQQAQWQDRAIELRLYGDGQHRALLERLAGQRCVPRIRFCGHVSSIEKIWAENHVLVQPSRLEGLPLSVVEAMLCRRVVVATDVAGHREVIDDGETGFVAAAATVVHLNEALERMWARRSELRAMGSEAGRRVRSKIPEDPTGAFFKQLAIIYGCLEQQGRLNRNHPRLVRQSHYPALGEATQHAHLFFARGEAFSEAQKLVANYASKQWVELRFSGLVGTIRFDPGAQPATYSIRRLSLADIGGDKRFEANGADVAQFLQVEGTISSVRITPDEVVIVSYGDDPILLIKNPKADDPGILILTVEIFAK